MSYFFFVASRFTGGHMIQGWALLLTLFGLVLLLLGPRAMRYLLGWSVTPVSSPGG